MLLLVLLSLT
jgi:hypothetical protein